MRNGNDVPSCVASWATTLSLKVPHHELLNSRVRVRPASLHAALPVACQCGQLHPRAEQEPRASCVPGHPDT